MTKGAYYNENDPFAAEWLRALILFGHIAPGDVDERSIEDVCPDDLRGYVQHHFFADIGVWSRALRDAGWPDDRPVWTGSCPCQPFSAAGKGGGFDDERHLWPAWAWLIGEHRPSTILGEQVASAPGRTWFDLVSSDLEGMDYACGSVDMCAAGIGAPHIRQRLWWMANASVPDQHRGPSGREQPLRQPGEGAVFLADTLSAGRTTRGPGTRIGSPSSSSSAGDVVDAPSQQEGFPGRSRLPRGPGGLAHDDDERRDRIGAQPEQGGRSVPADDRIVGDDDAGLAVGSLTAIEQRPLRIEGATLGETGLVRGRWAGADWIFCRDGKYRPVEAGTFPLAHGAPARVGRLRGYGNAIVLPLATAFIEEVMAVIDV